MLAKLIHNEVTYDLLFGNDILCLFFIEFVSVEVNIILSLNIL